MGKLKITNTFSLPSEIYEKVLAYCSNHDIYRVSQTCRYLHQVSTRLLYRIIPKMDLSRTIDFLISVCFYKHQAPYVWSLTIVLSKTDIRTPLPKLEIFQRLRKLGNPIKAIPFRNVLQDYVTLLSTVLKKLINLRTLELRLMPSDSLNNNAIRLLENPPFQLRTFNTTLEWGSAMCQFLRTQNEMKDLQCPIPLRHRRKLIPPDILPCLTAFYWTNESSMETVRYVIQGRPIKKVAVRFHRKCTNISPFIDIGPSSRNIKLALFSFQSASIKSENIRAIALQFPAATEVAIKIKDMTEEFVERTSVAIHDFSSLKRLMLTGRQAINRDWEGEYKPLFDKCFENCRTLLCIMIPISIRNGVTIHHTIRSPWHKKRVRQIADSAIDNSSFI